MWKLWLLVMAVALLGLADPDEQPACIARCHATHEAALAQCQAMSDPNRQDECRDDAQEQRQECIDDCEE